VVCLAWVFFRADNLTTVSELFLRLLHGGGSTALTTAVLLAILAGFALQFVPKAPLLRAQLIFASIGAVPQGILLASVLVVSGALVSGQGIAPFIYYQF
jgi:hypothetical protein